MVPRSVLSFSQKVHMLLVDQGRLKRALQVTLQSLLQWLGWQLLGERHTVYSPSKVMHCHSFAADLIVDAQVSC